MLLSFCSIFSRSSRKIDLVNVYLIDDLVDVDMAVDLVDVEHYVDRDA